MLVVRDNTPSVLAGAFIARILILLSHPSSSGCMR